MGIINGLVTALLILVFLGIWIWAWSSSNKKDFEEMSNLPLEDGSDTKQENPNE